MLYKEDTIDKQFMVSQKNFYIIQIYKLDCTIAL